jgi:stringent starvation protein B
MAADESMISELMTSNKPYLIRALNEWIIDNQMTPFLLVDANIDGVEVPAQHIRDGKIILNIAPGAVQEIALEDEWIYFSARFSGQAFMINVPINAVLAIYAKENGQGMMFAGDEPSVENNTGLESKESDNIDISGTQTKQQSNRKKPVLTVVK